MKNVRILNSLKNANLSLEDLQGMSLLDLRRIPNIGVKRAWQLWSMLNEIKKNEYRKTEVVVVTRHSALLDYCIEVGLITKDASSMGHVSPEDIRGKHVIGVLPLSLAAEAASVTEIPLTVPAEMRGKELTIEQIKLYAGPPKTYKVVELV